MYSFPIIKIAYGLVVFSHLMIDTSKIFELRVILKIISRCKNQILKSSLSVAKKLVNFCYSSNNEGYINSMAITADQKFLITAGEDGLVIIWNLESKKPRTRLSRASYSKKFSFGGGISWNYMRLSRCH